MDVLFARALARAWPHLGMHAGTPGKPVWLVTDGSASLAARASAAFGMLPRIVPFEALVRLLHGALGGRGEVMTPTEEAAVAAAVCVETGLSAGLGPEAPSILLDAARAPDTDGLEPELAGAARLLRARLLGVAGRVPLATAVDGLRRALLVPGPAFAAFAAPIGALALVGVSGLPAPARALLISLADALLRHDVPTRVFLHCGRLRGGDDPLGLVVEDDEDPSIAAFSAERAWRRAVVARALQGEPGATLRVALAADVALDVDAAAALVERPDPVDRAAERLASGEAGDLAGVRAVRCPDPHAELAFVVEEAARAVRAGRPVAIGVPDPDRRGDAIVWALRRLGLEASFPEGRPLLRWPLARRFLADPDPALLEAADPGEWDVAERLRAIVAEVDAAEGTMSPSDPQASLFLPDLAARPFDRGAILGLSIRRARLAPPSGHVDVVSMASLADHPAELRIAMDLAGAEAHDGGDALGTVAALVREGWHGGGEVVLTWAETSDGRAVHPPPWLGAWFPRPEAVPVAPLPQPPARGPREPVAVVPAARRLRVTAVEAYARCPIRWWLRDRLKVQEVRDDTPDVPADLRGTAAHGILERFVREWGARPVDAPGAREMLHQIATDTFDGLAAATPAHAAYLREEKHRWTDGLLDEHPGGLLVAWLERERQAMAGVVPAAVEVTISLVIDDVELVGRLDRVDRVRDAGLLVTDYKTGHAPTLSEIRKGQALQMVAYRAAIEQGALPDLGEGPVAATFLELRRPGEVERRSWMGDPELVRALAPSRRGTLPLPPAATAALYQHLRDTVSRMRRGVVHPTLADPDEVGCGSCPYRAICRHDPSTTLDWAGRDDVQAPLGVS